jgi:SAM-dependent methyltransferase
MPTWDELFDNEAFRWREPHERVVSFARDLKARGAVRVLDLGCGAGRHTVYLAAQGFAVCGTDISPRGLELSRAWLQQEGLEADLQLSDMTVIPYPDAYFDAVISTQVIHHNTLDNIRRCVAEIHRALAPGGRALLIVQSKGSHSYGKGEQLEPDTFLRRDGEDSGLPHHYFDQAGLRELLAQFRIVTLEELVRESQGPDGETRLSCHWAVLAEKHGSQPAAIDKGRLPRPN